MGNYCRPELLVRIAEARRSMLNRAKQSFDRTEDQELRDLCNGLRNLRLLEEKSARAPFGRVISVFWLGRGLAG